MASPAIPSRSPSANQNPPSLQAAHSPRQAPLPHAAATDNASTPRTGEPAKSGPHSESISDGPAMSTPVASDTDQAVYKKPRMDFSSSQSQQSQSSQSQSSQSQSQSGQQSQPKSSQPQQIQPSQNPPQLQQIQPLQNQPSVQAQNQAPLQSQAPGHPQNQAPHAQPSQPAQHRPQDDVATPTPGPSSTGSAAQSPSLSAGELSKESIRPSGTTVCLNCMTTTTPLWRRDEHGQILCNACGLFLKLHGRRRPISLKTDVIKSRNRSRNGTQSRRFARKGRSPGSSVDQSPQVGPHAGPLPVDYAHIDVLSLRDRSGKPDTPTGSDSSVSSGGSSARPAQSQQPQSQQPQQVPPQQGRPVPRVRPAPGGPMPFGVSPAGSPALAPQPHGAPVPAMGYVPQMMAPPGASPAPGPYGFYSNTPLMGPQTGAVPALSALSMHAPLSPAVPLRAASPPDIRLVRGHMSEQLLPRSPPGGERIVPLGQIPAAQISQDQTVPRSRDLQTRISELELVNDMFRRRIADLEFSEAQARKSAAEAWAIVDSVRPMPAAAKAEAEARAQQQALAEVQARGLAPQPPQQPQAQSQAQTLHQPQTQPQAQHQQPQQPHQHQPVAQPVAQPQPVAQHAQASLPPLHSLHSLVIAAQHAQPAESPAVKPEPEASMVPPRPLSGEPQLTHTPQSATATPVEVGKSPHVPPAQATPSQPSQPSPVDSPQAGQVGVGSPPLQRAFPHLGRSTPNGRLSTVLEPVKAESPAESPRPVRGQSPQPGPTQSGEDLKPVKRIRVSELI